MARASWWCVFAVVVNFATGEIPVELGTAGDFGQFLETSKTLSHMSNTSHTMHIFCLTIPHTQQNFDFIYNLYADELLLLSARY
jgi:hypothetical protein